MHFHPRLIGAKAPAKTGTAAIRCCPSVAKRGNVIARRVDTNVLGHKRLGPVLQKPDWPNPGLSRNFSASLFVNMRRFLYRKCLNRNVENKTNGPSFSSFKLVLTAGSEIVEMKNFTNLGLAQSGIEKLSPGLGLQNLCPPRTSRAWQNESTFGKHAHVSSVYVLVLPGLTVRILYPCQQVQQNGRLLTVFSSSFYCGGSNEAACILAHQSRLRTIRLDTSWRERRDVTTRSSSRWGWRENVGGKTRGNIMLAKPIGSHEKGKRDSLRQRRFSTVRSGKAH